jgi:RimJ/RimL family protein N-acetyltransferase
MTRTGAALVDGRGAIRIAAAVRAACLSSREVQSADAQDLFQWRTHPQNWRFNLSQNTMPDIQSHVDWLERKLADRRCQFMIIQQGDKPIAVVRFDIAENARTAELSIYLVPNQHGRKMGLAVYMAAESMLRDAHPEVSEVTSHIHAHNRASQRRHVDAGFEVAAVEDNADWMTAHRKF